MYCEQSMSAPEDTELQSAVTEALLPNVKKSKTFFDLARDVEQVSQPVYNGAAAQHQLF